MFHNDLPMKDTAIAGLRTWLLHGREAFEFVETVLDQNAGVWIR